VRRVSVLLAALALPLSACAFNAGGPTQAAGHTAPAEVADADHVIVAGDMFYEDPPTSLSAGTHVLAIDNQGRAPHDLVFDRGVGQVAFAGGGEQAAGEVTLEPGEFVVYCSVSGHRQAGMEFTLTVE
jgi:uncharacterized cupredoxin-like copper-binding protein